MATVYVRCGANVAEDVRATMKSQGHDCVIYGVDVARDDMEDGKKSDAVLREMVACQAMAVIWPLWPNCNNAESLIEMGAAIGMGMPVVVVKRPASPCIHLSGPMVYCFDTVDAAAREVARLVDEHGQAMEGDDDDDDMACDLLAFEDDDDDLDEDEDIRFFFEDIK